MLLEASRIWSVPYIVVSECAADGASTVTPNQETSASTEPATNPTTAPTTSPATNGTTPETNATTTPEMNATTTPETNVTSPTTTEGNSSTVTTVPMTTPTTEPAVTTPLPPPAATYELKSGNTTCTIMMVSLQLEVPYEKTDNTTVSTIAWISEGDNVIIQSKQNLPHMFGRHMY